jgi:hypothetical protein
MKKGAIWFCVILACVGVIGLVVYHIKTSSTRIASSQAYEETLGTPGSVQNLEEGQIFQALGSTVVEGCHFVFLQKPGTFQIKVYLAATGNTIDVGRNYRVERKFQALLKDIGTCEEIKVLAPYYGSLPEANTNPGTSTNNVSK